MRKQAAYVINDYHTAYTGKYKLGKFYDIMKS